MATLDQHVAALMGDQLLTIARQAAQIDALREALAAATTPPAPPPPDPGLPDRAAPCP